MLSAFAILGATLALAGLGTGLPSLQSRAASPVSNAQSSLTLLYQNNLNLTDDFNHAGAILLDPMTRSEATTACGALSEKLLPRSTLERHQQDLVRQLSYLAYAGRASPLQLYIIDDGVLAVAESRGELTFPTLSYEPQKLPVLCTQSNMANTPSNSAANSTDEIIVMSNTNTYVGFRNQKSFRFLGIPYAQPPQRFVYSVPYAGTHQTLQATQYGSQCLQAYSGGSEDCLFLNIQTPYIPKQGSAKDLRPVFFWIHGGGFTGGSGADASTDGSQLNSREDVVVVEINYRLSTLGFLAVPNTTVNGNYGIADQINALDWTIRNIAQFGGDPNMITIAGNSAGAGSVRVHLGSPKAIGKFQGAIAESNLGGGVDLGFTGNYGTSYSSYYTIEQSYEASSALFGEVGCSNGTVQQQIACLESASASAIQNAATVARYVVQDGIYVNTPELILSGPNKNTAHVNVIFGNAENDGASFSTYPRPDVTNETAGIMAALGISEQYASAIISSGLFPYYDTGNVTADSFNVSQRVATDNTFRCVDEATIYAGATNNAFKSGYYFQSDRTGTSGYDPNLLGGAPVEPGYPYGDPNLPYYKLHTSDQAITFGWQYPYRDAADLYSEQLMVGYFGSFIRTGNPNPSQHYLQVRGYQTVIEGLEKTGPWNSVTGISGPVHHFDWPGENTDFIDKPQCAFLNYSISYYKGM